MSRIRITSNNLQHRELYMTQWSLDCALCVDRKTLENIILPNILVHYHAAIILSYNFIVYQSIICIRGAIIVLLTMRGIGVTRESINEFNLTHGMYFKILG